MSVYVYTISCPITNDIKYVGMSSNIIKRFSDHLKSKSNTRSAKWIRDLSNNSLVPIFSILESFNDWNKASMYERYWIHQFTWYGFDLLNDTERFFESSFYKYNNIEHQLVNRKISKKANKNHKHENQNIGH